MEKSQLITVIVITTILTSMFAVYSTNNLVTASIITPSVDAAATSHQILKNNEPSSLTITTSTTQEIIYASSYIQKSGRSLSISSAPSLTWHYRGGGNTSSSNGEIASWWAVSPTAQTITITFTASGADTGGSVMYAFCVKDANTESPFDPNLSTPVFSHATSGDASSSISTTNPNDLVIGVLGLATNKVKTAGSGYTQIDNTGATSPSGANEYLAASGTETYTPTFGIESQSSAWVEVADAFASTQVTPSTSLTIATNLGTVDKGNPVAITGALTSQNTGISGKTVTISFFDGSQWVQVGTVQTQADGSYHYDWTVPIDLPNGPYYLKSDFAGDSSYLSCTSTVSGNNLSLVVLPEYEFGGIIGIAACFAAMALFFSRKKTTQKSRK